MNRHHRSAAMGRQRKEEPRYYGNHPCHFSCGKVLETKFSPSAMKWLWFTGYGGQPVHFCPDCRWSRAKEIAAIKEKLDVKPAGYPAVRVSLSATGHRTDSVDETWP